MKHSVSGLPKNRLVHGTVRTVMKLNRNPAIRTLLKPIATEGVVKRVLTAYGRNLVKPELPLEVRQELGPIFRDDILRLQDLIQRDLSPWLETPGEASVGPLQHPKA